MVKDAELHAEEDKNRKEAVEAKNNLDNLVYTTEKSIKDLDGKLPASDKENVEKEIANAKKVLETSSNDKKALTDAYESLMKVSHKLSEEMYKNASQQNQQAASGASDASSNDSKKSDDDVVDADYEEVK